MLRKNLKAKIKIMKKTLNTFSLGLEYFKEKIFLSSIHFSYSSLNLIQTQNMGLFFWQKWIQISFPVLVRRLLSCFSMSYFFFFFCLLPFTLPFLHAKFIFDAWEGIELHLHWKEKLVLKSRNLSRIFAPVYDWRKKSEEQVRLIKDVGTREEYV